jgi:hypothetical protein
LETLQKIVLDHDTKYLDFSAKIFIYYSLFYDQKPKNFVFKKIETEIQINLENILEKITSGDFLKQILLFVKPVYFFGNILSNSEFFAVLLKDQIPVLFEVNFLEFDFK